MNRRILTILTICGIMTGTMLDPAFAGRGKGKGKSGGKPAAVPVLTDAESNDLLFMREEEKLSPVD